MPPPKIETDYKGRLPFILMLVSLVECTCDFIAHSLEGAALLSIISCTTHVVSFLGPNNVDVMRRRSALLEVRPSKTHVLTEAKLKNYFIFHLFK
jgi:hypothetical protein